MNKSTNKKRVDGYLTIGKEINESSDDVDLPNEEMFGEISKGLIDVAKSLAERNANIAKICSEELIKTGTKLKEMVKPLTEMTKSIIEAYNPIINSSFSSITEIFKKIDWSQYDLIFKEIAIRYLSNGFYPYKNTCIEYEELLNTKNQTKQIKIIKEGIRIDIKKNKKILLNIYPEHKRIINEIYKLYGQRRYRLCILSMINLISIINNNQFEYIDFTEKYKVRKKLLEKQIMKEKETNYLLFSQYIKDDDLINANKILKDCRDTPEEYLKIPYNRNAILHGYSKKFGSEINCLRWFSVLNNTTEISQKLKNVEYEINNQ